MTASPTAAAGGASASDRDALEGMVMTVRGPVAADRLGITLPHEHIFLQHTAPSVFLTDPETAVAEVARFVAAGGRTIVEMTNRGLKREPAGLRRVAARTGVQIVMGCGYYKARWHPDDMDTRSAAVIAQEIVDDIMVGADGTDVRAGVIGEIGIGSLTANEEKVVHASAAAQQRTGAAINLHFDTGAPEPLRMRVLDLLERDGVDLNRLATSHFQPIPGERDYHARMAERGTYVEFDLFGQERLGTAAIPEYRQESEVIRTLIERGHLDRILFSCDICYGQTLVCNGGWGYAHVLENVAPRLRRHGFTPGELDAIMVVNPRRLFPFRGSRIVAGPSRSGMRERDAPATLPGDGDPGRSP